MLTFNYNIYIISKEKIIKGGRKMKEQFLELLKKVKREGIDELIQFLEKSDFFIAPASTRFHGNHEGGLVEHSIKVYEILKHKVENSILKIDIPEESIIIIGLLHDICKTNFYKVDFRNAKNALGSLGKSTILHNRRYNTIWTWRKISNDDYRIYEINTRRKILYTLAYGIH